MQTPGVVFVLLGLAAVIVGVRRLWTNRASLAKIRDQPLKDDDDCAGFEAVRETLDDVGDPSAVSPARARWALHHWMQSPGRLA